MTQRTMFWKITSILIIINFIGCTSVQTIEAPPDKLHEQIRHENLVRVGDEIRIVTEDKKEHQFVVTAINESEIRGKDVTVPIDSIVALQTREFSSEKTTFNVLATGLGIAVLGPFIIAMALALTL